MTPTALTKQITSMQYSKLENYTHYLSVISAARTSRYQKRRVNTYTRIIRFMESKELPSFTYKAFLLVELQVNTNLIRAKLIPYLFIARELCVYRLVTVNNKSISNPRSLLALYDCLAIPRELYLKAYSRLYKKHF